MSRNTPWTEAEITTLTELFPTHTTQAVAKLLGRTESAVYAWATRNGVKKAMYNSHTTTGKILAACKDPNGKCTSELMAITGVGADTTTFVCWLVRNKRLYRAGIYRHYRFFVSEADAKAWDILAPAEYARIRKELADKRREYNKLRGREWRAKQASKRPLRVKAEKPVKPQAVKVIPQAPVQKREGDKRVQLHITNRAKEQCAPVAARVVWPEHVKVQVHPTPPSRFDFTPPPGWRGEISKDWMNRRLGTSANARG